MSQAGEMSSSALLESVWGVYLWLTPAFLTLPEPLDHLHGTVISSSGLWWSAVAWRDLFCPCLSGVFPPWQG